jgi:hypothetical protein
VTPESISPASRDVTACLCDKGDGASAESARWQTVATWIMWGVSGLDHTQTSEVFQDIPNTQTGETSYIQCRHFGAAFALHWVAILGNRLKTVKSARRSSACIVRLSIAGTGSPAAFSTESLYSVLPIPQRLTPKHAKTAARRAKSGHHTRESRLSWQRMLDVSIGAESVR